jgi:hypothetical protein
MVRARVLRFTAGLLGVTPGAFLLGARARAAPARGTFYNGQTAARQRLGDDSLPVARVLQPFSAPLLESPADRADEPGMSDALARVSGVDLSSSVSVAVARKAMDAAKIEGSAMVRLIQSAAKIQTDAPHRQAAPGEPGTRLDSVA